MSNPNTSSGAVAPQVVAVLIAPSKAKPMVRCDSIRAIASKGLVGDRYGEGTGFYSGDKTWDANVTLIQQEAIDAVNQGHQASFTPELMRRNLVTKNIRLRSLIGRTFRIGDVVLRGVKDWPPCSYLAKMCGVREVTNYFADAGGIGAEVIEGGVIRVDDVIEVLDDA